MQRFCFALDLKNDPDLIKEYIKYHKYVWPQIIKSIKDSGIINMEIYHHGNRLFMVMETIDTFTLERKKKMDEENRKVQEWEKLMWKYQQAIPNVNPGTKWQLMDTIFKLSDY